jgi:calcineurin-like phosphoesterase
MTGPHDGIIGVESRIVLTRFLRGVPARLETSTGNAILHGVVVEIDERTGRAVHIERIRAS